MDIESLSGFISMMMSDASKQRKKGLCPVCHGVIREKDFRDELSKKEFKISGMCQVCQDDTFKKGE